MNNIRRELTLPAPIEKVKQVIDSIGEHGKGKGFVLNNKNDVLNTYRIGIISGLTVCNCNVTLTKKDEETVGVFEMIGTNRNNDNIQNSALDGFLNIIGKGISGEPITSEMVGNNKSGCLGVILFLIFSSALLYSIF